MHSLQLIRLEATHSTTKSVKLTITSTACVSTKACHRQAAQTLHSLYLLNDDEDLVAATALDLVNISLGSDSLFPLTTNKY